MIYCSMTNEIGRLGIKRLPHITLTACPTGEATAVPTVSRRRVGMGRFMIFWQAVAG